MSIPALINLNGDQYLLTKKVNIIGRGRDCVVPLKVNSVVYV